MSSFSNGVAFAVLILFSFIAEAGTSFHHAPPSTGRLRNPYASDERAIREGAKLFAANCTTCHGAGGIGMGNVPGLASGTVQQAPDGELFWFIAKGSVENGMPPSRLPRTQRWQIVSYIKSLGKDWDGGTRAPVENRSRQTSHASIDAPPPAPFTDYRYEKPGEIHHIRVTDLPSPTAHFLVGNGPTVVPRPAGAWPKVPPGFKVQLYADGLENPRLIRTAPNGDIFLAESEAGRIRVFRGLTADGKPAQTEIYATGLELPYGIAFYPPGPDPKWLYVGNTDAVIRFPYRSGDLRASGPSQKIADLPHGRGHWTRPVEFSADGKKLFVAVGSASNVDDPDTHPGEKERADILVMTPEGNERSIYASGIRNAGGGLAIQPGTGDLWCSTNERDGLGDNLVPDYITRVTPGAQRQARRAQRASSTPPRYAGARVLRGQPVSRGVSRRPLRLAARLVESLGTHGLRIDSRAVPPNVASDGRVRGLHDRIRRR